MKIIPATRAESDRAATLMRLIVLLALILIPATARASGAQDVASDVYVERQEFAADGSRRIRLEPAAQVRSGDSLVFRLNYRVNGDEAPKMLTSAVPDSVSFIGGGDIVSVDDGRHWGRLDTLRMRARNGSIRRALPEDVTHVRWVVGERSSARSGLLFRGRAR